MDLLFERQNCKERGEERGTEWRGGEKSGEERRGEKREVFPFVDSVTNGSAQGWARPKHGASSGSSIWVQVDTPLGPLLLLSEAH